jgi:hypothetical protein
VRVRVRVRVRVIGLGSSILPSGSTAMMRMEGLRVLAATAMPDSMPPPLTGTRMASSCGSSCRLVGV